MAGGNKAKRSDRMELSKDSDDEGERHVFRQVETVTALCSRLPCVYLRLCHDGLNATKIKTEF
ncbi:MAG: hypothetical protein LBC02_13260 [Planctomycetaceae bacterium]|nr:hypothetical protein [Planctomycetaceae bacterium]